MKRYYVTVTEDPLGDMIHYSDHEAALAERDKRIKELEAEVKRMRKLYEPTPTEAVELLKAASNMCVCWCAPSDLCLAHRAQAFLDRYEGKGQELAND